MPELSVLPSDEQVVCSLYEGHYHYGLAATINSLVNTGFSGLFWVGFRGELPPWIGQLQRGADGIYEVGKARLVFETITVGRHFGQYKPEFFSSLIDRGIATRYLWYTDPDATFRCEWSFFERWVRYGVCLIQDMMNIMPPLHPFRCEWMELARNDGWGEPVHQHEYYYASGFMAMDIADREFLERWKGAVRLANGNGVKPGDFQKRRRPQLFARVDQDAMNIATMYAAVPFSTMGPEAMGFVPGGFATHHAYGILKPWRKNFLAEALRGAPPSPADKDFFRCAGGPIQPYSRARLKWLRTTVAAAALVGRFYSRN